MAQRRQEIEAFVRHLVVEVEAAEATGMTAPQAIAICATRRVSSKTDGLVGGAHVGCGTVAVRVDRDGRQTQLSARPHDPDSDLAPVGDQDFHWGKEQPQAGASSEKSSI